MNKKLLILDIDETLISGSSERLQHKEDAISAWCFLYKRPYVEDFMEFCMNHFRVAVWTTATPEHATFCLSNICAADYPFEFIWTRERCTLARRSIGTGHHWIKSLDKIKRHGFSLDETIMLDDTPSALSRNYGNLVRIEKYHGGMKDMELLRVMPYLLQLKEVDNVRAIEKRGWNAHLAIPLPHHIEQWIEQYKSGDHP